MKKHVCCLTSNVGCRRSTQPKFLFFVAAKRQQGILFAAVLFFCLLSACAGEDADPAALKTYDFGRDKVPSITAVVGERTVTEVASEGKNEFPSKQYTYQSNSVADDLSQYTQLLQEQAWTTTGDGYNLKESPGSAQFVKESADNGQILILFITYEENQYAIKVTKLEALIDHT